MEQKEIIKLIDKEIAINWENIEQQKSNKLGFIAIKLRIRYYSGKIIALDTLKAKILKNWYMTEYANLFYAKKNSGQILNKNIIVRTDVVIKDSRQ